MGSWGWLDESPLKKKIEIIAGDVCDPTVVSQAMEGAQIVFHLAALIGIPYSYRAPESYVRTNVGGTLNILQAARRIAPERVVLTSTSEVYGTARYVPIDENHPLQSQSPYSASKIAADKLGEAFHHSFSLPIVTVRPFNTYGPRQSTRAIVPVILTQCLDGNTVRLGNIRPMRDLNYVADIVEGFLQAACSPVAVGHTINIGSGHAVEVGELARLIGRLMKKKIVIKIDRERVRPRGSEVDRLQADNTLAQKLLGWRPQYSLEKGLRITIDWLRGQRSRHKYDSKAYTL